MKSSLNLGGPDSRAKDIQWKKGARVLGISESFQKEDRTSYVSGVIMRGDMRIDGFGFCNPTVGGNDSTKELLRMYNQISRDDIRAWMLGGNVVSWFNIIDIELLFQETDIPVLSVSYDDSDGIDEYIREYFPDDYKDKIDLLQRMGDRTMVRLDNGFELHILTAGMNHTSALHLLNLFTLDGRVPEPIRVARMLSSALREHKA